MVRGTLLVVWMGTDVVQMGRTRPHATQSPEDGMARHNTRPLVNLLMDPEEIDQIDEFRYDNRFPSRAAAIKYLIFTRLEQQPTPTREEWARFDPRFPQRLSRAS